jgi:2'-5' RNA ligase
MGERFGDVHKIRTFIAVPVTDEARQRVGDAERELASAGAAVKWVEPRNVHLTLKFLGDTKTRQIDDLAAAIRESLLGAAVFDLELAGIGTFPPGRRNIRVIWIGTGEGKERLADLARRVEDACGRVGFAKEARPFAAHLTVGRVRPGSGSLDRLAARVAEVTFNPLKVAVERVNLTRSELSPKGPTYTVLESFALEHS